MSPTLICDVLVEEFQKRKDPGAYMNFLRSLSNQWTKEAPELWGYRLAVRHIESNPYLLRRLFALPAREAA